MFRLLIIRYLYKCTDLIQFSFYYEYERYFKLCLDEERCVDT